ncbi:MerR family transcriptional regulator [Bdellovibrio sp. KM01]|uniref:MerR family transcriptional regulator n=1 Tax=Bdellovibrio sp. KM01 TaxID=2748865 RepID=UPI0015EA3437|nr:MerR family transcriptional regulator [Bdellovibrio sp. KM01]QLY24695.1 MerR family transcriptional regulator [Bdellovibrio sp. KM01]
MVTPDALLDIDQVNQLTGLSQATLRNWERRYGFPRPQRSQGGHRLYDVGEVKRIREVASLYKNGIKIVDAIEQVLNGIATVRGNSEPASFPTSSVLLETLNEGLAQVLKALYRYDMDFAEQQLSRLGMRLSETDLLEMVYPKLLMQVGDDWENSRINIAQEHFSWNFLRTRLLNYFKTNRSGTGQPKVLLATPSGELHEGGLIVLAAYLMLKGWSVYYLGVNLPIEDLLHAYVNIEPDIVCLSAIDSTNIQKNWTDLEKIKAVAVGGPCLAQLRSQELPHSKNIFFVDGSLHSAVSQMDLLIQQFKT